MSKKFLLFSVALFFTGCYSASKLNLKPLSQIPRDERLLVAVLDFQNNTGDAANASHVLGFSSKLLTEMQNTQLFRLVEREKIQSLVGELNLGLNGIVDESKAKQIGKMLGVDALVVGSVNAVKQSRSKSSIFIMWTEAQKVEMDVTARLVSVETSEILCASQSLSFIKQRNWVAFWVARLGGKIELSTMIQSALDGAAKQIANDLAAKAPTKKEL